LPIHLEGPTFLGPSFQKRRAFSGNLFFDYQPTKEIQETITRVDELKQEINLSMSSINGNLKETIQKKLKFEWTYHSNAIEGSRLSLGDTIFFLQEGLTVNGKPLKDFLDAKNHADAIDYFYEVIKQERPLSPHLMRELNQLLLLGVTSTPAIDPDGKKTTKPARPGQYKALPNHVLQLDGTIHHYVEPMHVESEMDDLFAWINEQIDIQHPLITAAIAHYNMVRIHPFDDGNGRGSRILMNLILLKKHYPLAVIKIENRNAYITSLNKADKGDIHPFMACVSHAMIETQNVVLSEIKRYGAEKKITLPRSSR
jgi:Fic family protein